MADRREFVKQAGLLGLALTVDPHHLVTWPVNNYVQGRTLRMDAVVRDLLMEALNAAKLAGASYADVRIGRQRQSSVQTREHQIVSVGDNETAGCGVRALVDGCWGFAATPRLTKDGVALAAREAASVAKANRLARDQRVELAPAQSYGDASWRSDYTIDPWDISLDEKTTLLLNANAEALKVANVKFVNSGLSFVKDERNFASTDGSVIIQEFIRCQPTVNITAVASDFTDF